MKAQTAPSKTLTFDYDEDQAEADKRLAAWVKQNAPFKANNLNRGRYPYH